MPVANIFMRRHGSAQLLRSLLQRGCRLCQGEGRQPWNRGLHHLLEDITCKDGPHVVPLSFNVLPFLFWCTATDVCTATGNTVLVCDAVCHPILS